MGEHTNTHRIGRRALIPIALLALVLRAAWGVLVPVVPVSDSHAYDTFARNIAAGVGMAWGGPGALSAQAARDAGARSTADRPGKEGPPSPPVPTAYWPVGAPAAYGALYAVFGYSYIPVVGFHVVLGVGITVLGATLGARWFGRVAGIVAGYILACWPWHVQFTTILASELPFTLLVLLGTHAWLAFHDSKPDAHGSNGRRTLRALATGVCFGLATLVRPTAILIPCVLAGIEFLTLRHRFRTILAGAACVAVMGACVAPWAYRNTSLFGQFVLVSTNGGVNLWMGNNPDTTGEYQPELRAERGMSEAAWNDMHKAQAMEFIKADPGAFLWRSIGKGVRLHDRETIGVAWNKDGLARAWPRLFAPIDDPGPPARVVPHERRTATRVLKLVSSAYWFGVLALALVGVPLLLWRGPLWTSINHPAIVLWSYFTAVHAVIVVQDRYHFPSTPFVAALAGFTIASVWARVGRASPARERA